MTDQDKEAVAISAVINALADLDEASCERVLEYAMKRFVPSLMEVRREVAHASPPHTTGNLEGPVAKPSEKATDIRSLREEKQPANGIQMAVLVAYYLKELSPPGERKESIGTAEVTKYFNQARFQLPTGKKGVGDTLNNARRAGYLETAGTGHFKLTAVGHNLAAYNLPVKKQSR